MTDKKVAGLWIDGRKAIVVTNHNAQEVTDFAVREVVKADVQHGNPTECCAQCGTDQPFKVLQRNRKVDYKQY
jgi:hypothetical protein